MTSLITVSARPHKITAECPVSCLQGIVPTNTYNSLHYELPHGSVGEVARMLLEDQLQPMRGIGAGGIERIRRALAGAGLLAQAAPAAPGLAAAILPLSEPGIQEREG